LFGEWNGEQCLLGTINDDTGDLGQTGAADVATDGKQIIFDNDFYHF
jgi:hypothetical protein